MQSELSYNKKSKQQQPQSTIDQKAPKVENMLVSGKNFPVKIKNLKSGTYTWINNRKRLSTLNENGN